jgi:hypothetical protein
VRKKRSKSHGVRELPSGSENMNSASISPVALLFPSDLSSIGGPMTARACTDEGALSKTSKAHMPLAKKSRRVSDTSLPASDHALSFSSVETHFTTLLFNGKIQLGN